MIFNILTCIPLSINPCRREIYITFLKRDIKNWEHFIITSLLLGLSAIIGVAFPDVLNAFSMLGGFCDVPIVILYPGLLYLKHGPEKKTHPKKIAILISTIILSLAGFAAAFISLF